VHFAIGHFHKHFHHRSYSGIRDSIALKKNEKKVLTVFGAPA
jgi:hypothetical protein